MAGYCRDPNSQELGEEVCNEDEPFLRMLLCLRTAVSRHHRGEYLRFDLSIAEKLTDQRGHFQSRLDTISARTKHVLSPLLDEVREAINNNDDRCSTMPL